MPPREIAQRSGLPGNRRSLLTSRLRRAAARPAQLISRGDQHPLKDPPIGEEKERERLRTNRRERDRKHRMKIPREARKAGEERERERERERGRERQIVSHHHRAIGSPPGRRPVLIGKAAATAAATDTVRIFFAGGAPCVCFHYKSPMIGRPWKKRRTHGGRKGGGRGERRRGYDEVVGCLNRKSPGNVPI